MTEEFKQALVQSIIDQRGFTENEQIYKDLVALVKESNDQLFIAKVYNDLAMYDKVQAQMSNQLISFESVSLRVTPADLSALSISPLINPGDGVAYTLGAKGGFLK